MNMLFVLFDCVCMFDCFFMVVVDGVYFVQMVIQYLLDYGSKWIVFIGGVNYLDIVRKRKYGYFEVLRENKIFIEKDLVVCWKIDFEEGKIVIEILLLFLEFFDVIFVMNDILVFVVMEVIRNYNFCIFQDIVFIGYIDE